MKVTIKYIYEANLLLERTFFLYGLIIFQLPFDLCYGTEIRMNQCLTQTFLYERIEIFYNENQIFCLLEA